MTDQPQFESGPTLKRRPIIVLICGLLSLAMGILLLVFGGELQWYGIGIVLCALGLIGMWLLDRKDVQLVETDPDGLKPFKYNTPGPWYPVALIGIVIIQFCWIFYIQKR